jgi:preprotein translocase subunit SecF
VASKDAKNSTKVDEAPTATDTEPGDSELTDSAAVELGESAQLPHHGFFTRLYTGTGAFEVIGRRKMWFAISGAIVAVAIASIVIRGFTFGIDFEGGTKVSFPRGEATTQQVEEVFSQTLGHSAESVVIVGNGSSATVQIRTETLANADTNKLREALFEKFQPKGADGQPSKQAISDSAVSSTWGGQITKKALIALLVFVVIVSAYITIRYERYMAISALATMFFDLLVTAGVYSLVGFEVTPATVIGLLTILGFSLYDTVIVFDKVEENTHGFEHTTRRTFAEQANLAINQTFMRSINTSLISVLPVIALIVVAVWLLGVGTLKDLALVQLVGIIVGTYSSIFFATPLLVTMRERTDKVRVHTRRVINRRKKSSGGDTVAAEAPAADSAAAAASVSAPRPAAPAAGPRASAPSKPAPGARPSRPVSGRPTGKRNTRQG